MTNYDVWAQGVQACEAVAKAKMDNMEAKDELQTQARLEDQM